MDVSYLLDGLNDAQRQAVCAEPSNQLILAGAGSGKTRVLVHRIAWLVQVLGVSPHQIMAVTFTNKAAKEMRERLQAALGEASSGAFRNLWVGTFHSIAHRLLKAHWQDAGLPQNFQILDSDDQLRLIKRVCQQLNLDEERWPAKQAQWFINEQKDEGVRPAHIVEGADVYLATMKAVYQGYEETCQRGGMVDFAELLLRSHELWLTKPALLKHYQQRFKHILVDEFQDTNAVQYAWLRVLAGTSGQVTAVGDDDQSIYGWRGARIENIQQFDQHFAATQTTRLEQNYRSSKTILEAANTVIANNRGRLGKNLWTEGLQGEPIDLYAAFNEQDEARFVVERINSWVAQGNPRQSAAILYRSNAQSRVLEEALIREGVPYRIYGGQRFYERLEIKNALAYLRLLQNREDDAAFERVLNTPTRGIGSKTEEILRQSARDQNISLYKSALGLLKNNVLPNRAASSLAGFLSLLSKLEQEVNEFPLAELVAHVINESGLLQFHQNEKGERGQARVENLQELVNACGAFKAEDLDEERTELAAFLDLAALDAGDAQADAFTDAVQLMTLHSAKGLEFPLVFLVGVEEHLFPHKMSADTKEGLEEERRLCYVGITRAMHKLILTYAESRRLYGSETHNPPSRFLREIPSELIQEVRVKSTIVIPANQRFKQQDISDAPGLRLGQSVNHSVFGEGVILQFEGQGPAARVQVAFESAGTKWLVAQYAKLEPLN
ncbi:MAG: DNA helicase II [Marinagarivorans sp.]